MINKLLFFMSIFLLNLKSASSSGLSELENLQKDPFVIICNNLDVESFEKLALTSKKIYNKIKKLVEISESKNEDEVKKLIQKFENLFKNEKIGISVEEYFWLFSFEKMQSYDLTLNDIVAYQKIQQRKAILKTAPLRFGRIRTYEKLNTQLYNCFYHDFKKRSVEFNGEPIEKRKIVLLQWGKIDFLSPCIREFKNVTDLHIFNNNLCFILKEIGDCVTLKYIDLSFNNLVFLPDEISRCTQLEKIRLVENKNLNIKAIQRIFSKNKKLKIEFIEPLYLHYMLQN